MKKEELKSVQRLEVPETETKASKEQKKKEEPKNSEQVKEKDDVPNFGTQEEETKAVEEILSGPAPKTGEESRILVFSVLLGMSVTVMGGTIYELFASVTTLTCTDAIYETQNQIRFYFTLDDGSILFASYKKEDNSFFFWTEKKEDSEQAIAEWFKQKEADTKAVDTSSWEESQDLPIEWNEKGQENIPVVLSGKENLQGKILEEDLNYLETKLQKFLEENNELRRELSIPADKIIQTDQEITFEADFITPRIDKKQLQVTYHIKEKSFGFMIQ